MILQMHLLWIGLVVCAVDAGASLQFTGAEGQWASFPMWNTCCESEMSFSMRTTSLKGLLVYYDDEDFCNFLELHIQEGKLRLCFSIFCAEPASILSDVVISDNQWHEVTIRRNFRNTTLIVDKEKKWQVVESKRRDMTVFSHLFLGGIPPELRLMSLQLTSDTVKDHTAFMGWIRDLKVNNSEPVIINSAWVRTDLCGSHNMCLNGGVCSLVSNEPSCDCSETGYHGKDCGEGKISLFSNIACD